jgi:MoaA/NifB/PqqE/SkfB family radical SAM enzyme
MTTRCNFGCFHCAGRQMRQGNMPYDTFTALLDQHIATYGVPKVVSLQGEGEPTLDHDFLRMAEFVRDRGATPYTITNAYRIQTLGNFHVTLRGDTISLECHDSRKAVFKNIGITFP